MIRFANFLKDYISLGIFGTALITQLLGTFGILKGINVIVWEYLVVYGSAILAFIYGLFVFLAYEDAYSCFNST